MAKFLTHENFAISYFGILFEKEEENIRKIRDKEKLIEELKTKEFDYIMLPIPMGETYVKGTDQLIKCEELSEYLKYQKKAKLFGGKLKSTFIQEMEKEKIACCDLMREDGIVIYNAKLTAENAVIEAILLSDSAIINSECLVIGYGNCGKMLSDTLKGMKARVTVAEADEKKVMLAVSYGYKVEQLKDLGKYKFIFQTAPKEGILDDKLLNTCLNSKRTDE